MTSFTDALSAFGAKIGAWAVETEADVQAVIAAFVKGLEVAEADIDAAAKWLANETPTIATALEEVLSLISSLNFTSVPDISTAVKDANSAVTALNAFASSVNAGSTDGAAIVSGYQAFTQAQAAVTSAKATVVAQAAVTTGTSA